MLAAQMQKLQQERRAGEEFLLRVEGAENVCRYIMAEAIKAAEVKQLAEAGARQDGEVERRLAENTNHEQPA